jgi:uncharacterized membrane protein YhaH (DUF805 family)
MSGLAHLLFSFKGRIKRLEYNVAGLIVGLINSFFIYSVFSNSTSGQSSFFSIIALLSGIYVITALNVKRLHDLGKSGAWLCCRWQVQCSIFLALPRCLLVQLTAAQSYFSFLLSSLLPVSS